MKDLGYNRGPGRYVVIKAVLQRIKGGDFRDWLLARLPKHSVCAEIGVYKGDFSRLVLSRVKPAEYHLIDPWRFFPDPVFEKSLYGGSMGQNQANMDSIYDSVCKSFSNRPSVVIHRKMSAEAAAQFPDHHFDWIYIDANHQYEGVKQDLALWLPKLKPGGLMTGDDYGNPGWWNDGVRKAVNEFISTHRCKTICMENRQFLVQVEEPS